ncbi:MAG: endolytic transglycosylase MltG [Minisyncoccales bacterium]
MRKNKILFLTIFIALVILIIAVYFRLIYLPLDPLAKEEIIFQIKKGEGAKEIALNLEREKLIRDALMFRVYALFKGVAANLKAGNYRLSPAMNIPQMVDKFFKGEIIKEKIVIIEGWNILDVENELSSKLKIQDSDFQIQNFKIADFQEEFSFLKDAPAQANLEGFLFPDTYEIIIGASPEDIIRKILSNFNKKLGPELREEIKRQNKSIYEIITLASLIEKEAKILTEKKLVAGILWKRLENKMPLQVDATIAYLLGIKNWQFDEMRKEIALNRGIDSPYNTYKYRGLPPGPIANPGLESILAAIYPEESDYWYYLTTSDGQTIFSRTLEEHNLAKAKYYKN